MSMLSPAAEFGIRLEAYLTTLLSTLDPDALAYKLNELEEDLLSIIGTMNEDTLRPVIINFIADLNEQLAPLAWPRDLHVTNISFISDNTTTEADMLPLPIGGTAPSKYSDEIKVHSVGICGDGLHVKLNYLTTGGVVSDSAEFQLIYQLADWTSIGVDEPGYPHQWRWISAFDHSGLNPRYLSRPIYRSAELSYRELLPATSYTGFNISADVNSSAVGEIMHDIGICYDTPADESCIILKVA